MTTAISLVCVMITLQTPGAAGDGHIATSPSPEDLKRDLAVRESMIGDRPFSALITYTERKRILRMGPLRSKVQVIQAAWAGQDRARIDMIEDPGHSLGFETPEHIVMTSDENGSRRLSWAKKQDKNEPSGYERQGTVPVGQIVPQKGLYWAAPPRQLLHLGLWSLSNGAYFAWEDVQSLRLEKVDGLDTVRVEWSMDSRNPPGSAMAGVFWIAPALGHSVIRSERSRRPTPDSPWKKIADLRCAQFASVGGVWLPRRITLVEHSYWDDGFYEFKRELDTRFDQWKVDENPGDKSFKLEFPKGTQVVDRTAGK